MSRPRATSTDAIVDAGARLFQERGYHSTTIEDIAAAANVSKPTVYQYARNKQWILDQALIRVMDNLDSMGARVEWDPEVPLDEQFENFVRMNIEGATRMRVFFAILLSEESQMSRALRDRFRAWAHDVTDRFAELLGMYEQQGRLPIDTNPRVLANLFVSMFVSLHRWYDPEGPVSPEDLVQILRRLATREPSENEMPQGTEDD